ncbi:hypothetical protein H7H80_12530, partial [Mycobacterium interjectum]|nr:hypothetical protein [Mycobacterium interjectum]
MTAEPSRVANLRLISALGALATAVAVGWQSAPAGMGGDGPVELRSTAAPM